MDIKSNLIKNHVISNIPEEAAQTDLSDDWNKIFDETIGDKQGDDDFLRESLRSRYFDKHQLPNISSDVKASKNNLYKIIKTIDGGII